MDLTNEQKKNAIAWLAKHKEYVSKLVETDNVEYVPSSEDVSQPELWKAAHWRWFIDIYL